jgi:hypothetical protein
LGGAGEDGSINPNIHTVPGILFLISTMMTCAYILGSRLLLGVITFKDSFLVNDESSYQKLMQLSIWRFFREWFICIGLFLVIGIGIAVAQFIFKK